MEAKSENKPSMTLVVVGHLDSGKSTTTGHLIYKSTPDKGAFKRIEREIKEREIGLKYDYFLDMLKAEGRIPPDFRHHIWKVEAPKHRLNLIDISTHGSGYMKRMLDSTSDADAVILMISASLGEFEAGFSQEGQTGEFASLAHILGLRQMIVCVNKMDHKTVKWSQSRFEEIHNETQSLLKKIGYDISKIPIIPISATNGDNMFEKSANLSWFKGPTLFEAFDDLVPPKKPKDNPLRIPVRDVYRIGGIGTVVVGKVESGVLRQGMELCFGPTNIKIECKTIEKHHESIQEAIPGETVGFCVKPLTVKDIKRGHVCGDPKNDPPRKVESFEAKIIFVNHPGTIKVGYCPVIYYHTAKVTCRFSEIKARVDLRTGVVLEENPQSIKGSDCAIVTLVPIKPICVEAIQDYPTLSRFEIKELRQTVAVGVIQSVKKQKILDEN